MTVETVPYELYREHIDTLHEHLDWLRAQHDRNYKPNEDLKEEVKRLRDNNGRLSTCLALAMAEAIKQAAANNEEVDADKIETWAAVLGDMPLEPDEDDEDDEDEVPTG